MTPVRPAACIRIKEIFLAVFLLLPNDSFNLSYILSIHVYLDSVSYTFGLFLFSCLPLHD